MFTFQKYRLLIAIALFSTIFALYSCENSTDGGNYIKGKVTREQWSSSVGFGSYAIYTPDTNEVKSIKTIFALHQEIRFSLYASPWCSTCQTKVPQVFRVFDAIGYPDSLLTFVALDYSKSDPDGLAKKDNVTEVFTLLIKTNGTEIGRLTDGYWPNLETAIRKILEKIN
jgi:hypothetical protein